MRSEPREVSEVSELIRSLGSDANLPPLPDPDRLWVLAQIAAEEQVAARALRMATLRQALRYGLPAAGAVWLFLEVLETEGPGLDAGIQTLASLSADPVNVAISALAALAAALLTGGLVLGRSLVVQRLRDFGLL